MIQLLEELVEIVEIYPVFGHIAAGVVPVEVVVGIVVVGIVVVEVVVGTVVVEVVDTAAVEVPDTGAVEVADTGAEMGLVGSELMVVVAVVGMLSVELILLPLEAHTIFFDHTLIS